MSKNEPRPADTITDRWRGTTARHYCTQWVLDSSSKPNDAIDFVKKIMQSPPPPLDQANIGELQITIRWASDGPTTVDIDFPLPKRHAPQPPG